MTDKPFVDNPEPHRPSPSEVHKVILGRFVDKVDRMVNIAEGIVASHTSDQNALPKWLNKNKDSCRIELEAMNVFPGGRGSGRVTIDHNLPLKPNDDPSEIATYLASQGLDLKKAHTIEIGEHIDRETIDYVDEAIDIGARGGRIHQTLFVLAENKDGSQALEKFNLYTVLYKTQNGTWVVIREALDVMKMPLYLMSLSNTTRIYYKSELKPQDFQMVGAAIDRVEEQITMTVVKKEDHASDSGE